MPFEWNNAMGHRGGIPAFWDWFDIEAAPRLGMRELSFRKIFAYLDDLPDPVVIVETGCLRKEGNWEGDGQSTLLFARYAGARGNGAEVLSVDIDPVATATCAMVVGEGATLHTGDSIAFLHGLTRRFLAEGRLVSLFYLDSFDLNWSYPTESAIHHLKEMVAISPLLARTPALVVVDDCPQTLVGWFADDGSYKILRSPQVGGKGSLIADYARSVGARQVFSYYQAAFTGF